MPKLHLIYGYVTASTVRVINKQKIKRTPFKKMYPLVAGEVMGSNIDLNRVI